MPKYRVVNQNGETEPTVDFWLETQGDSLQLCAKDTEDFEWVLLDITKGKLTLSESIDSSVFVLDSAGRLKVHK